MESRRRRFLRYRRTLAKRFLLSPVMCPDRRKQEPFGKCPSVAKKTPPSRFHTVPLAAFADFFPELSLELSLLSVRFSMRDCLERADEAAKAHISPQQKMEMTRSANITSSQKKSLTQGEGCGDGKRFRRRDRRLDLL